MFKLFGGQKQNRGFYLELNETEEGQPAPEPAAAPEPVAVVAEPPPPVKTPVEKKTSAKKSVKQAKPTAVETPAPVAVSPSSATNGSESEPQVVNFATDYLVVQTMSRRLPGPSLKPFKEMASKIKTPTTKA